LSANEAKPTFALPNPNVGKLVHLRNQIGIAADFAIEGIVQLSGRITANPGSSPKIGLCPDCPQHIHINSRSLFWLEMAYTSGSDWHMRCAL